MRRLRRCAGIKLEDLNSILAELAKNGKIRINAEIWPFYEGPDDPDGLDPAG
jgi:hypothetical protein